MSSDANETAEDAGDGVDDHVDDEIASYLLLSQPRSFFLFAGAGSGKTRSLVNALTNVRSQDGPRLRRAGKQIGVITYTNAACEEITRRLDNDPLFGVSTIHSFAWGLIRDFNVDIRTWLTANLDTEIQELQEQLLKGRKGTKAATERARSLGAKQKRLTDLPSVRRFVYSPTGDNRTRDSLNHSEVIKLTADFITKKPLMQDLLVGRFPILLIDESQDTNKLLMEALLKLQVAHEGRFALGLFGDTMQRIYADGKSDLGRDLSAAWATPSKVMNHRCPRRVVRLINKIRFPVDGQQQRPRTAAIDGLARLFLARSDADKMSTEKHVRERMASLSADECWREVVQVKTLTLEHHMSASRLGFLDMFQPLYQCEEFRTGLLDGSLPCVRLFSELVMPVVRAKRDGSEFSVAALVRKSSPLLQEDALKNAGCDQRVQLAAANAGVNALCDDCSDSARTFNEVLHRVAEHNLFEIPEALYPFASEGETQSDEEAEDLQDGNGENDMLKAIRQFLQTPFQQIEQYSAYVKGQAAFGTHQGVKGLEFPRVVVVMDDAEARGFMFSFEKLFGAKDKTSTDFDNERAGTETGIDRTRRLFYVTCSRAMRSLAIVGYTSDVVKVQRFAVHEGWFADDEIEVVE